MMPSFSSFRVSSRHGFTRIFTDREAKVIREIREDLWLIFQSAKEPFARVSLLPLHLFESWGYGEFSK